MRKRQTERQKTRKRKTDTQTKEKERGGKQTDNRNYLNEVKPSKFELF